MPTEYSPTYVIDAYELAADGKTDREIAQELQIPFTAVITWKRKRPAFKEAIKRGRKAYTPPYHESLQAITNPRQMAFLMAYVEAGTIKHAAQISNVGYSTHIGWMAKSETYQKAFEIAKQAHADVLLKAAMDRGVYGNRKYKFTSGGQPQWIDCEKDDPEARQYEDVETGEIRYRRHYYEVVYSDQLLIRLMEHRIKGFRPTTSDTNVNVGTTVVLQDILDDVEKKRNLTIDANYVKKAAEAYLEVNNMTGDQTDDE